MLTGQDEQGSMLPHGVGFSDDVVFLPLQASTQWDGLGVRVFHAAWLRFW